MTLGKDNNPVLNLFPGAGQQSWLYVSGILPAMANFLVERDTKKVV
jgi:hypothetical protein